MPNWNYNSVEIHADADAVMARLVPQPAETPAEWASKPYNFNMHKLFPEHVPESDPTGNATWNYDWFVDNTGSKWSPEVYICHSDVAGVTVLSYDTAWSPNNGTLQRLHEKTGRTIRNEYREEGMQFAGCFICEAGDCRDEDREYLPICEICEQEKPEDAFDEEADDRICNDCRRRPKKLIS